MQKNDKKIELIIILFIFLFAFLPRFLNADLFVNTDASTWWFDRSEKFMRGFLAGNFSETAAGDGSPGVTLMWLSGGSMALQNLLLGRGVFDFANKANLLLAAKLPIILITTFTIVAVFLIMRKLTGNRNLALLAAFFLLIDPLFLAYSRFFQMDALMASFSILSLLLFLLFLKKNKKSYLIFSAISFGLGFLTKTPALLVVPSVFVIFLIDNYIKREPLLRGVRFLLFWLIIGLLSFFILFPACWTIPGQIIKKVLLDGILVPVIFKHEVPNLLIVSPLIEKLYHLLYLLTRLTPFLLVIFIAGLIGCLQKLKKKTLRGLDFRERYSFYILLFTAIYFLVMFAAGKQAGRYLLPLVLALNIFCAFWLYSFIQWLQKNNFYRKHFVYGIIVFFFLAQIFSVFRTHPYYSAYRNILFPVLNQGALATSNAFSFGWGEGLEKAADYLNRKKNSDNLIVASWHRNSFQIFFKGWAIFLDDWQASDYVVLYQNQVHRGLYPELIEKTLANKDIKPEKIIKINGYEYAWLYKTEEILK